MKLDKPLYHGTSAASALCIAAGERLKVPVYLTENKTAAEHYGKAACAYLEHFARKNGSSVLKEGYAILTFTSVPDKNLLRIDDYNEAERGQWTYPRPLGLKHCSIEYHSLEADDSEKLRLCCFAIGMWQS